MNYERGLRELKSRLPAQARQELDIAEFRLRETLEQERLFGSTETLRSERSQIVHNLNRLARQHLGVSFGELCLTPSRSTVPATSPSQSSSGYTIHIEQAQGIAIGDGATVRPATATAPNATAPPQVEVQLLTNTIPTAYCHHLDEEQFPLITVTLDNSGPGCSNATLRVQAAIEDYSYRAVTSVSLLQGEQRRTRLLPILKPDARSTLTEVRHASLRVTVEQIAPQNRVLYDNTSRVHLLAHDVALLGTRTPEGETVDLTPYLAAWVTPHHPQIEALLSQTATYHPDRAITGYQGASTIDQAQRAVRAQARAIYTTLEQEVQLVYVNASLSLGTQPDQITQRVRLPGETVRQRGAANCLDGAVLFASLLELAGIEPQLILVPGHALVGWRVWPNVERYDMVDTTAIGRYPFERAIDEAQTIFDHAREKGYFQRPLFDPGGFARIIDVTAQRAAGVFPLE